ncbi:MAG: hypothetical protein H6715_01370 [Myxococcales bacterium]|nr:hypothetical protein [Myxococcales bacterium]
MICTFGLPLFGCKLNGNGVRQDQSPQHAPALIPVRVTPSQSSSLPVYTLNHLRGVLAPTERSLKLTAGKEFRAFGVEAVFWKGDLVMRIQVELAPEPAYILVSEASSIVIDEPISPDFVSVATGDCPLFSLDRQSSQRLISSQRISHGERVFLFTDHEQPFVNIVLENDWRDLHPTWWVSRRCISHLTPWIYSAYDDISTLYLGTEESPFVRQLASDFGVAWNLRLSDRETKRRAGESCYDILDGLPQSAPLLVNVERDEDGNDGEPYFAVPIYVCAEYVQGEDRYVYHMRPSILTLPTSSIWPGTLASIDLLVFNLSPNDSVGFGAQAWSSSAYSAFGEDLFDHDEEYLDNSDEEDELTDESDQSDFLTIFPLEPGVENAIWVQLMSDPQRGFLDMFYAAGQEPLDYYDDTSGEIQDWLANTSLRGLLIAPP